MSDDALETRARERGWRPTHAIAVFTPGQHVPERLVIMVGPRGAVTAREFLDDTPPTHCAVSVDANGVRLRGQAVRQLSVAELEPESLPSSPTADPPSSPAAPVPTDPPGSPTAPSSPTVGG